ncbi:MAG: transposase [Clostridia bacterium]|nr:transposase [Clostridia bacterium]
MDIPAWDLPLAEKIRECQDECVKTYGFRRVHIWLEKHNIHRNHKTVLRVMQKYGFTYKEMRDFKTRYNKNQRKLATGIAIKPKGRPRKDGATLPPSVQQLSKLSQLQYELASKERYIKRLEMENELMRDFLSLTERK